MCPRLHARVEVALLGLVDSGADATFGVASAPAAAPCHPDFAVSTGRAAPRLTDTVIAAREVGGVPTALCALQIYRIDCSHILYVDFALPSLE